MIDIAGSVEYINEVIAPGIRELDQASEILHSGEYIAEEITIGINDLSNLKVRGDLGAKNRTAKNNIDAAPHARMRTIFIGFIVFAACERNG
jgi:hypothetical protein